jgi:hypothetical protein
MLVKNASNSQPIATLKFEGKTVQNLRESIEKKLLPKGNAGKGEIGKITTGEGKEIKFDDQLQSLTSILLEPVVENSTFGF